MEAIEKLDFNKPYTKNSKRLWRVKHEQRNC